MVDVLRGVDLQAELDAEALGIRREPTNHLRAGEPLIARHRESQLRSRFELHEVIRDRLVHRHLATTIAIHVGIDAQAGRYEPGAFDELAEARRGFIADVREISKALEADDFEPRADAKLGDLLDQRFERVATRVVFVRQAVDRRSQADVGACHLSSPSCAATSATGAAVP